MKTMIALRALFLVAAFALAPAAIGQIYKWTDENGVLVYSDKLPADLSRVTDFGAVDSARLSPAERRTIEILNQERHRLGPPESAQAADPIIVDEWTRRVSRWRGHTEAVNDPCLISSDPRCHERHRADYDPRLGYAPSILRGEAGATATLGAGGIAGGGSR
jgi:hypothetical protein